MIEEGAYLERQVFTTDVERVQMWVPERMVHENGAQRAAKALQRKRRASLVQRELDVLQLAVQEGGVVTRTLLGGSPLRRESPRRT